MARKGHFFWIFRKGNSFFGFFPTLMASLDTRGIPEDAEPRVIDSRSPDG